MAEFYEDPYAEDMDPEDVARQVEFALDPEYEDWTQQRLFGAIRDAVRERYERPILRDAGYRDTFNLPLGVMLYGVDDPIRRHVIYGDEELETVKWKFKGRGTKADVNEVDILVPKRRATRPQSIGAWIRESTKRMQSRLRSRNFTIGVTDTVENDRAHLVGAYRHLFQPEEYDDGGAGVDDDDGVVGGGQADDDFEVYDRRYIPQRGDWDPDNHHVRGRRMRRRFGPDEERPIPRDITVGGFRTILDHIRVSVERWAYEQMEQIHGKTPAELLSSFKARFNLDEIASPMMLGAFDEACDIILDKLFPYDAEGIDQEEQRNHRKLSILSTVIGKGMLPLLEVMRDIAASNREDPQLVETENGPASITLTPVVRSENNLYSWVLTDEMTNLLGGSILDSFTNAFDSLWTDYLNNKISYADFVQGFRAVQDAFLQDEVARVEEMGSDMPASPLRLIGGRTTKAARDYYPTLSFGFRQSHDRLYGSPYVSMRGKQLMRDENGVYRVFNSDTPLYFSGDRSSIYQNHALGGFAAENDVGVHDLPFAPQIEAQLQGMVVPHDDSVHVKRRPGKRGYRFPVRREPLPKKPRGPPPMVRHTPLRKTRRDKGVARPSMRGPRAMRLYTRPRGKWAPYTCDLEGVDLEVLQIEKTGGDFKFSALPCLVYACKMSNQFTEEEIGEMLRFVAQPFTLLQSLPKVAAHFETRFRVYEGDGKTVRHYGPTNSRRKIELCFFDNHFCLNTTLPYTKVALENWETVYPQFGHGMVTRRNRRFVETNTGQVTTRQLLNILKEKGALSPLKWTDDKALGKKFLQAWAFTDDTLEYCPKFCPEFKTVTKSPVISPARLFFGDFEACTRGEIHLPYMFAMVGAHNFKKVLRFKPSAQNENWTKALLGVFMDGWNHQIREEGVDAMNRGGEPAMYIYFHNLDYDCAFLLRYLGKYCTGSLITNCNTIIGFDITIPGFPAKVRIRDSYRYISTALRNFGKMFNLEIEKEIFPYDYYQPDTLESLRLSRWGKVDAFLDAIAPDMRGELEQRIARYINQNDFSEIDVYGYAAYYCIRDCEVLMKGFMTFRDQLIEFTSLDPVEYFTISSLAYASLNYRGVFTGCHQLSGPPLFFIRRCVNGGRCMLSCNRKRVEYGEIADFDAVSLYPSAMSKLWTIQGLPNVIPADWDIKKLFELYTSKRINDFFIEIRLTRVPKALEFPLIPHDFGDTKTYINEPTDSLFIDNLWLEDLMTFHEVTLDDVELKRGYYFDSGRNLTICSVIVDLFNKRLEYKQAKNPLEQIVKLLMNSCYGKSILKPVLFERYVMDGEKLDRTISNERSALLGFCQLDMCDNYLVKENTKLKSVVGFPTFGVQVLSMSKRIMSEVMVTAQDCGIPIFYTDTDSMHLPENRLPELQARFLHKYGRDLIGKGMGQFHTDFSVPGKDGDWYSEMFIGVGKKCYIDVLRNRKNLADKEYHIRLKGVPLESYMDACRREACSPEELMMRLYNGDQIAFDLLAGGRVSFMRTKGLGRSTRLNFGREVRFLEKYPFTICEEVSCPEESE